jgi:PAS domain S-box-containing protein
VLGSFCVIDREPRGWTADEVASVADLAGWAATEVELRLERAELIRSERERQEMAAELRGAAARLEEAVERRTAELSAAMERLREGEERFRSVVERMAEGLIITDLESRIVYANPSVEEIFGWRPEELLGRVSWEVLVAPEEQAAMADRIPRRREGERERYQVRSRRRDGSVGWIEVAAAPFRDASGEVVGTLGAVTDVTERFRAEQALEAQREYLRAVIDSLPSALFAKDQEGRFTLVNRACAALYGRTPEEMLRGRDADVNPDAGQVAAFLEADREVFRSGGRPLVVEEPVTLTTTGETRWYQTRKVGLFPPDGGPLQVLGIATDITDRRRAEEALAESQRQLLQSQKMEAVGRLAGGIAHDFNNMLMAIGGHAELLRTDPGLPETSRWQAEEIGKAATRAAGLTRQLLAFSRKQVLQPRPLSVNTVVSDLEEMLRRLLGEDVRLRTALDSGVGVVRADPGQLEQVLVNLAANARDAMPGGGTLTVATANVLLEAEFAGLDEDVAPGPYVMLAVTDTGTGMDEEVQQRIFEPFFTTKEQGKGTGLGLSTVYGIVRQSGGHVTVRSEPGVGTTFSVYLPREDAPRGPAQGQAPGAARRGGTETILLAEDDEVVRRLLKMFLDRQGYTVLDAADGAEALRRAGEHPGRIDLLLTDVTMPGMSGRELAARFRECWTETPVIYMSGYTDDAVIHHDLLDPGSEFIQKPVAPDLLAHRIRSVLDTQ